MQVQLLRLTSLRGHVILCVPAVSVAAAARMEGLQAGRESLPKRCCGRGNVTVLAERRRRRRSVVRRTSGRHGAARLEAVADRRLLDGLAS